ncbi:uncharacterized protein KZ484_012863 [Pholidichthys leucotaenia]
MEHNERSPEPTLMGTPNHACAVAIKLPDFWQHNPRSWFHLVEAQFALRGISADDTRFHYVVAALDARMAQHVESLLDQPPTDDKYGGLKAALIQHYTLSDGERAERLLTRTGLGDGSAIDLMEKMLRLKGTDDDHFIFTHLFLWNLPSAARATLANSPLLAKWDYRALAREANQIIVATRGCTTIAAVTELDATTRGGEEPSTAATEPPTAAAAGAKERGGDTLCFYHRRFAERARKCIPPCQFKRLRKRQDRGSVAAATLGEENKRLYLTDARSGRHFLVDTGAQKSFIRPTYADRLAGSSGPEIAAANGSGIKTFARVTRPTAQANVTATCGKFHTLLTQFPALTVPTFSAAIAKHGSFINVRVASLPFR